jgi:aminoglycoside phosphotransferase (APT) family kinase protein
MCEDQGNEVFISRLQKYFARHFGQDNLRVKLATQLFGGISRQTWRLDVAWTQPDGTEEERSLILRLDPPVSLLTSGRKVEYACYKAFASVPGIPVPGPVVDEDDAEHLGMSFMATDRVEGVASQHVFLQPPFVEAGPEIARQTFEILGKIAAADYRRLGLEAAMPVSDIERVWDVQLTQWEESLKEVSLGPQPITSAVIRKLRREPPPPPDQLSIVHGDYHFGNWLYTPGGITAIVDWEMAHLGDPHEDLAWAMLQSWRSRARPEKVMHYLDPAEAVSVWEEARGAKVNHDALHWWTLFCHVKSCAMSMRAAHEFETKTDAPLIYATTGWVVIDKAEVWMLEDMGGLSL